jgi:hypothetical protein
VIRAPHEQVVQSALAADASHAANVHEAVPQYSGGGGEGGPGDVMMPGQSVPSSHGGVDPKRSPRSGAAPQRVMMENSIGEGAASGRAVL